MKKLILMRHAKSDWNNSLDDFERPLSERGKKEAPIMGKFIKNEDLIPDLLISSPSQRTKETLDLILNEVKEDIKIKFNDIIYENSYSKIVNLISGTDDKIKTLMILGHNPSMEELSKYFTGLDNFYDKFVTSALVLIKFDIKDWNEVKKVKGELVYFKTPK